jgi:ferric-dicitrate binding protein FerR (iron transport regulator)
MKKRLDDGEKSGTSSEEAIRWMARKMSGAMDEREGAEFEKWLAASAANASEFAEVERSLAAADAHKDAFLAAEYERQLTRDASTRRLAIRAALIAAAAVGAAGAGALLFGWIWAD